MSGGPLVADSVGFAMVSRAVAAARRMAGSASASSGSMRGSAAGPLWASRSQSVRSAGRHRSAWSCRTMACAVSSGARRSMQTRREAASAAVAGFSVSRPMALAIAGMWASPGAWRTRSMSGQCGLPPGAARSNSWSVAGHRRSTRPAAAAAKSCGSRSAAAMRTSRPMTCARVLSAARPAVTSAPRASARSLGSARNWSRSGSAAPPTLPSLAHCSGELGRHLRRVRVSTARVRTAASGAVAATLRRRSMMSLDAPTAGRPTRRATHAANARGIAMASPDVGQAVGDRDAARFSALAQ